MLSTAVFVVVDVGIVDVVVGGVVAVVVVLC